MADDHLIDLAKWNNVLASIGASPGIVIAEPIGTGEGMLGRIFRLATDDASFVLKMVASGNPGVETFRPCEREALTYAWLEQRGSRLEGAVPRFYHWELEHDGFQCLLLEDLSARGAKTFNPLVGLRSEEVLAGLVSIARVHSAGSKRHTPRLADRPPDAFLLTGRSPELVGIIADALASVEGLLATYYPSARARQLARIFRKLSVPTVLARAHGESRLVGVCHGDLWSNNILFAQPGNAPNPVATIVDWQFSTWGNPLVDAAFLMISSMSPELRHAEQQTLLAAYYERLDENIRVGAGYNFNECLKDYHVAQPYGALMTLANFESYLAYPDKSELGRLLERFETIAVEFFGKESAAVR